MCKKTTWRSLTGWVLYHQFVWLQNTSKASWWLKQSWGYPTWGGHHSTIEASPDPSQVKRSTTSCRVRSLMTLIHSPIVVLNIRSHSRQGCSFCPGGGGLLALSSHGRCSRCTVLLAHWAASEYASTWNLHVLCSQWYEVAAWGCSSPLLHQKYLHRSQPASAMTGRTEASAHLTSALGEQLWLVSENQPLPGRQGPML